MLGARFCASCGSAHGVIDHPENGVNICIECLDYARSVVELDEGNGG
jgi:hypothetical protein